MKYKVGDKVKIREDLIVDNTYGADSYVEDMAQYKGEITTVISITDNNKYKLDVDSYWCWTDEMLEDVIEEDVIESESKDENTVDIGYYLEYCGHKVIENVYYCGYTHDQEHIYCTTVDGKNQYTLPVDSIEFIIPHED